MKSDDLAFEVPAESLDKDNVSELDALLKMAADKSKKERKSDAFGVHEEERGVGGGTGGSKVVSKGQI